MATLVARWDWRADLITHFQVPALVLTLVAAGSLAWRHRRAAIVFGLLAAVQAAPLVRYQGANPIPPDPRSPARLRILMANVLYKNPDRRSLVRLIRRERPDIVALVELSDDWLADLADVRQDYPYRLEAPAGGQGLSLWFREPPRSLDGPERLTPEGWPLLHATFDFAGRTRHLWLVHPASPTQSAGQRPAARELAALAVRVGRTDGSRIVVGDLNRTSGSPHFADFLRVSGLRDTRLGFGLQPSWPSWSPYRIAIDHAFLSPDLAAADRRLGPDIGSDHLPLLLDVAPAASADSKSTTQASQSSGSRE
jgi:endonuclease/exonuclease/phosphatase (EEP) superfamily protein YafD